MSQQPATLPVIFDYLNVVLYLKDYYKFRKGSQKSFSYESWSDELGFSNRSFLRLIAIGKKNVTQKLADAISEKTFSNADEKSYFFTLVKYSQSKNENEKNIFGQKMIQILKGRHTPQVIADFDDLVSSPLLPRLLSLFSYQDIKFNLNNISQILALSPELVLNALKALEKLKLATSTESNGETLWSSEVTVFKVSDTYGNLNLIKFHEKSLLEAIAAFKKPKETRRYKSLLLPMDSAELNEFNAVLDSFAAEQMVRFNSKLYSGKRVYQANFNIYPVTENFDVEKPSYQALTLFS